MHAVARNLFFPWYYDKRLNQPDNLLVVTIIIIIITIHLLRFGLLHSKIKSWVVEISIVREGLGIELEKNWNDSSEGMRLNVLFARSARPFLLIHLKSMKIHFYINGLY